MKTCTKCGEEKNLEDFYRHNKSKDGIRTQCKTCVDTSNFRSTRKWMEENKERRRNYSIHYKFGITRAQYDQLLEKQEGCCYICRRHHSKFKKALAIDHAHGESEWVPKGAIRGLLCDNCNRMVIGRNTNANWYERASEYLRQHTGWIVPIKKKKKTIKRKPNG